jgi:RNA polymerase sigma factor (sigma-70 family)
LLRLSQYMQVQEDIFYINQVLSGHTQAYTFLVEKHKRMAYTLALKMVRNTEDAEEIAQDAFIKAFHSLKEFKGQSKFSTWLFRIVYTLSVSKLRKKRWNFFSIDDVKYRTFDLAETDSALRQLSDAEQAEAVKKAVDKLPDDERALVTLYYLNESSIEEVSEITGLSVSNVKVKLFRTRKKLWEKLKIVGLD